LAHLALQSDHLPFLFFLVFLFAQPNWLLARSAFADPLAHHPVTSFLLQLVALPPSLTTATVVLLSGTQSFRAASASTPDHAPSGSPPLGAVSRRESVSPLKTIKPLSAPA
jgi:hypothetical protein